MVVVWGNILSLIGNAFAQAVEILVFDAFFTRNENTKNRWLYILLWWGISTFSAIAIGTKFGYTFKMLQEIAFLYIFCVFLYQSRWDRRFFIVVTIYAVLFSYSHWFESFCLYAGNLDYEEYIWNVPLYSVLFFVRGFISLFVALIIKKYHHPLHARTRASAWVPLSAIFPVCTLRVLRQVYIYPEEQHVWQICLLILDLVDIAALILFDYLEENAENREKLIAANERAHVQDENIQALSQAYAGQRKMTHDFRANLSTLSELLESERVDDAKEFLSELNVRQSERILLVNSHNAAIDAVLNQKGYIGKKQGIDMRFRVNDLSALRLPRVDVTIVLGNLIDNAMEACAGLSDPNRWVSIQILYSENMLSILIINPSNIVQINDGHIPTTKQDPLLHGFGIGNVKDILEKYHAEYLFTYADAYAHNLTVYLHEIEEREGISILGQINDALIDDDSPAPGGGFGNPFNDPNWEQHITSFFGKREDVGIPGKDTTNHNGLDIAYPYGTPILAVEAGTVIKAGYHVSYGNYLVINHGGGYCTLYAHCSQLLAQVGDTVNKYDTIAKVGATGDVTGNHLHICVIVDGVYVNPKGYLH